MRSARVFVPVLLASVVLTGCFTGKRGHLEASTVTTVVPLTDPAIQTVVAKLESANAGQYTAKYSVIVKYGNRTTSATVAQTDPAAQSITVGHVLFLTAGGGKTCELSTAACVTGLQDQQISDTQLPHNFYAASPALKLRQDTNTMVSAATASTKQIAGQNATCVDVHFAAGNKTYCALDSGILAQQDTPDLQIDLLSVTTGADQSLFTTSTTPTG